MSENDKDTKRSDTVALQERYDELDLRYQELDLDHQELKVDFEEFKETSNMIEKELESQLKDTLNRLDEIEEKYEALEIKRKNEVQELEFLLEKLRNENHQLNQEKAKLRKKLVKLEIFQEENQNNNRIKEMTIIEIEKEKNMLCEKVEIYKTEIETLTSKKEKEMEELNHVMKEKDEELQEFRRRHKTQEPKKQSMNIQTEDKLINDFIRSQSKTPEKKKIQIPSYCKGRPRNAFKSKSPKYSRARTITKVLQPFSSNHTPVRKAQIGNRVFFNNPLSSSLRMMLKSTVKMGNYHQHFINRESTGKSRGKSRAKSPTASQARKNKFDSRYANKLSNQKRRLQASVAKTNKTTGKKKKMRKSERGLDRKHRETIKDIFFKDRKDRKPSISKRERTRSLIKKYKAKLRKSKETMEEITQKSKNMLKYIGSDGNDENAILKDKNKFFNTSKTRYAKMLRNNSKAKTEIHKPSSVKKTHFKRIFGAGGKIYMQEIPREEKILISRTGVY